MQHSKIYAVELWDRKPDDVAASSRHKCSSKVWGDSSSRDPAHIEAEDKKADGRMDSLAGDLPAERPVPRAAQARCASHAGERGGRGLRAPGSGSGIHGHGTTARDRGCGMWGWSGARAYPQVRTEYLSTMLPGVCSRHRLPEGRRRGRGVAEHPVSLSGSGQMLPCVALWCQCAGLAHAHEDRALIVGPVGAEWWVRSGGWSEPGDVLEVGKGRLCQHRRLENSSMLESQRTGDRGGRYSRGGGVEDDEGDGKLLGGGGVAEDDVLDRAEAEKEGGEGVFVEGEPVLAPADPESAVVDGGGSGRRGGVEGGKVFLAESLALLLEGTEGEVEGRLGASSADLGKVLAVLEGDTLDHVLSVEVEGIVLAFFCKERVSAAVVEGAGGRVAEDLECKRDGWYWRAGGVSGPGAGRRTCFAVGLVDCSIGGGWEDAEDGVVVVVHGGEWEEGVVMTTVQRMDIV
ncbi:hypothetical protein PMAC_000133 [Pneumocystis sp. 'macacae']|nr:hypothetical protein PMAC_000133 [Pneumocystis sp. 'macacae']